MLLGAFFNIGTRTPVGVGLIARLVPSCTSALSPVRVHDMMERRVTKTKPLSTYQDTKTPEGTNCS